MNHSKICLVRLKKTDGYARHGTGYIGPLTMQQRSVEKLRLPFREEHDVERAVMSADLIGELQR